MLRTSGARFLFTVTDFLDTDYVALLDEAGARDLVEEIVILEGAVPADTVSWADFLARGAGVDAGTIDDEIDAREARPRRRHDVRHHLHVGHHRCAQGRDAAPRRQRARVRVVGRRRRPAPRRPLPPRVPAVPHRGAEVGARRVAAHRHHAAPSPRVRHPVGDGDGPGGADHDAPRTARDLPDHPQRRPVRSTTSRRCGSRSPAPRSCRSSWSCRCATQLGLESRRHRLRTHRDHRHRQHVPPRRRPRDHRPHLGPTDPRRRDEDRRRRRQRGAHRRAGRDRGARASR